MLEYSSACGGDGRLNSLSVLANSPHLSECAQLLAPYANSMLISLHVNVVDGPCCAQASDIPLLVDENGMFNNGFARLLFSARGKIRAEYKKQLEREIGAQIDAFLTQFPQKKEHFRVDSHQHFHMIPVVFDALMASLQARGCVIDFIRVPAEPMRPFVCTPGVWAHIPPINLIKQWLLKALWQCNKKALPQYAQQSAVFCGIAFSGTMTADRVNAVLPRFQQVAQKRGMPLELLFHPAGCDTASECLNPGLTGFVDFYTSPNRAAEGKTLRTL